MSKTAALSVEEAEEYTQALSQVVAGSWRQIAWADRNGVPQALGLSTREWVEERLGGYVRESIPARRKAVAELTKDGLSTRKAAEILGVSKSTVAEDLGVQNRTTDVDSQADEADVGVQDRTPDSHTEADRKTKARRDRDRQAEAKRDDRDLREAAVEEVPEPEIREGSLAAALTDVTDVDLVFTDPPYPREFLPAWSELATWAPGALKPGALLLAYSGQYHLPEVIARLAEHLDYQWLGWIATTGPHVAVHQRPVMSGGKPLLVFSNGPVTEPFRSRRFFDSAASEGRTRELHTWEQGEAPAAYYIEALTERGELVVDPFLGSGTTAFVCRELGRRFIGCDIDAGAIRTTQERLAA